MIIDRNSPIPKYFQLQTWLIEQIEMGVFKAHDKIPTEQEFKNLTGLARATIRQAVQNLVNMGYLLRKRRLGTFVIDQRREKLQTNIGLMIPDIRMGNAPELARGVEDEAARTQHSLILCSTDDLYVKADFHANRLINSSISGVIFIPTAASDDKNYQIIEKFMRRNILVVLADRSLPQIDIDYVTTDNFEGAYRQTEYLIKKGHTRIGIVISTSFNTERLRLEGYKKALADYNISVNGSIIITDSVPYNEERYMHYVTDLLKQRDKMTAIFAGHDRIALLFYSAAKKMGISIPDDISIVGYDDLPLMTIKLTTTHQPFYEMGQESMRLMLRRIRGESGNPQQIVLKSYFVERSSVLPYRNNSY